MTKTHKLERRISALETRIGLASDPVTEIWLVSPKEEVLPVLFWRMDPPSPEKPAA